MILLREVQEQDIDALERFAQIPGFINLPADRDLLKEKILRSQNAFRGGYKARWENKYIFVAEDIATRRILGTSMIAGQHGTEDSPHFYFEVGSEKKLAESIGTGFIHGTLMLKYDTDGPSEIGGLVIDPEHRNSDSRVGRQISFVRFMFVALNRGLFKSKIIAELLPPLNKKGQSPLWEAIGRRFTNLDYWEADTLCQKDKEFIFSLFPTGKIYTTFLTAEARNAIGKVGKDTEPVMHMLKKIGFEYKNQVDPFDGGPHLWGEVEKLVPVKNTKQLKYSSVSSIESVTEPVPGILAPSIQSPGTFRAVAISAQIQGETLTVHSPPVSEIKASLSLAEGDKVAFMSYY